MTKNKIETKINIKTKPEKFQATPVGFDEGEYDNQYLTVKQISELTNQSTSNVRKIILDIMGDLGACNIHKDGNLKWRVHKGNLPSFASTRKKWTKRYGFTIYPYYTYSKSETHRIMKFVLDNTKDDKLEMTYTIVAVDEAAVAQLHCFVKSNARKKLLKSIHEGFPRATCIRDDIFDFNDWRNYITMK